MASGPVAVAVANILLGRPLNIAAAYRRALPHEVAVNEIERCAGSQFDPEVSDTFVVGLDQYREEEAAKGNRVPE